MLKRLYTLCLIAAVLALPVLAAAGVSQEVALGNATVSTDNTITVPVSITNGDHLVGIDMAFKYSAGVTIKEVLFENTRIANWDLKATMLNDVNRTVVIMAVPQLGPSSKPPLAEGSGVVAQLVFQKTDPSVQTVTLEPTAVENPHHHTFFVYGYTDASGVWQQQSVDPVVKNGVVSVSASSGTDLPKAFALNQNYPNPFNPSTQIAFDLPVASRVQLTVFNVLGQNVRALVNADMAAGHQVVTWNGRSDNGSQVASGVYFYRLSAGSYTQTMKMMMLK